MIDVVIPCHPKDREVLDLCLSGCRKYIRDLRKIFVISDGLNIPDVTNIGEDGYYGNRISKERIAEQIQRISPDNVHRAGWLFQQFLKLASCEAIDDLSEEYLILDSDVIFLKPIQFFKNGKPLLRPSKEFHLPYYDLLEILFGQKITPEYSFISHHMPVVRSLLKQMLRFIERRFEQPWYQAILERIDYTKLNFSEYELIGYYLKMFCLKSFEMRTLINVQSFKWKYLPLVIFGLANYVTLHHYKHPDNNPRTSSFLYSFIYSILQRRNGSRI